MDSISAFIIGQLNKNNERMVFDWEKAARIIKERGAESASAGLCRDWEYTGGTIFNDGKPVSEDDTYVYLASTWAVPELQIESETIPCYRMESETPGWDEKTYWPESAIKILNE